MDPDLSTLLLQTVNFLVLVWLLHRFLYRPVLAAIDRRREENARVTAEAGRLREEAEALRSSLEEERRGLAAERARLLEQARAEAAAERQRLLEAGRQAAEAAAREARARLVCERGDAEAALRREAARLAVELARRLLEAAASPNLLAGFIDRACAALRAMPPAERATMADSAGRLPVRLVAASPLDADQRERCRQLLASLTGVEPQLELAVDPELIAGIELHLPHAVLRHNWRDTLHEALAGLTAEAAPESGERGIARHAG